MSTIPTCAVRAVVRDSVGGQPVSGAVVSARLSTYEVYQGYVVPHLVQATTDANGECVLDLWPNQLGAVESNYAVTIVALGKTLRTFCVVPSAPTAQLADISGLPAYDGQPDGAFVIAQALQAVADARAARDASATSAAQSAASAASALSSESNATASRNAAAISATNAAASENSATTSKTAAAGSAAAAATSQTDALASKNAALASQNLAQAWATQLVTPVAAGEYSAKYHALLAKGYAESIAAGPVYSVNGMVGVVTINAGTVGLGNVANLSPANLPISTAAANALALKADLVAGQVPASQLPSYVDDVLEYATLADFPVPGETGKLYIAINAATSANPTRQYRWTGSVYAEINPSPGTTDALAEGAVNLYFTVARVRDTVLGGLSTATNATITALDTVLTALGKLQRQITDNLGITVTKDSNTGAANISAGTTAQRPANGAGKLRYNTTIGRWEGNTGAAWGALGGASGGGNDSIFYESDIVMTADYTVPGGKNAMVAGPLTQAAGTTLTIPAGSTLTIV